MQQTVPGGASRLDTVIYKVDPLHPDEEIIARCADVLRRGGLVAFPTETVYGLGANALDPEAVARIFEAKGRPQDNPLILHISRLEGVDALVREISPRAERLMEMFWPGPLTLLFPRSYIVPDIVTAGLPTVAIRMPDHPVAQRLIDACGVPLAAPSANQSGRPSPTSARDVLADLNGKVDIIIDGGPTDIGVESTVLDVSGDSPIILRPGGLTREDIEAALSTGRIKNGAVTRVTYDVCDTCGHGRKPFSFSAAGTAPSPGMKYRHYAPRAEMYIAKGTPLAQQQKIIFHSIRFALSGKKVVVLASQENFPLYTPFQKSLLEGLFNVILLGSREDLSPVAARLYSSLRHSEELGAQVIISETFSLQGLGLAISNRLEKASGGKELSELGSGPLRVVMVCTGNTCRSPMAEGLFRRLWKDAGEPYSVEVISRGVTAVPGLPASEEAVHAMRARDVDISSHVSKPVSSRDMAGADLVIAMTLAHKKLLLSRYSEFENKIRTLSEVLPGVFDGDVMDPYGQAQTVYDNTADVLEQSLRVLTKRLAGIEST
jgi:L-threonylcarbamoyladenylate synthase